MQLILNFEIEEILNTVIVSDGVKRSQYFKSF